MTQDGTRVRHTRIKNFLLERGDQGATTAEVGQALGDRTVSGSLSVLFQRGYLERRGEPRNYTWIANPEACGPNGGGNRLAYAEHMQVEIVHDAPSTPTAEELAIRRRNRGRGKHPYLCPICAHVVRSAPTTSDDPQRAPRRLGIHFVKGARCPGSHLVVRIVRPPIRAARPAEAPA